MRVKDNLRIGTENARTDGDHEDATAFTLKRRRVALGSVIGAILGMLLLYAASRKVDFSVLAETIVMLDWFWALGIFLAAVSFIALKACRWKILLPPTSNVRFGTLNAAVYIGLAANFLVSHVGEVIRTIIVTRASRLAVSAVVATVVVERLLDFVALLILTSILVVSFPGVPDVIRDAGFILSTVVVGGISILYMLLYPAAWLSRIVRSVLARMRASWRGWLRRQYELIVGGLKLLRTPGVMFSATILSLLQWVLIVFAIFCSCLAVGTSVSTLAAFVVFIVIVLGLSLPNAPLQIGTTQLAFVIGLELDGVSQTNAVAASVVYTAFLIVPVILLGGLALLSVRTSAPSGLR